MDSGRLLEQIQNEIGHLIRKHGLKLKGKRNNEQGIVNNEFGSRMYKVEVESKSPEVMRF
jgi:hypothetical protein